MIGNQIQLDPGSPKFFGKLLKICKVHSYQITSFGLISIITEPLNHGSNWHWLAKQILPATPNPSKVHSKGEWASLFNNDVELLRDLWMLLCNDDGWSRA